MARTKQIDRVLDLLHDKQIMFVTGAGMSTDSGIPDYRGKGMLAKNPLIADKYVFDHIYRRKFWIRAVREWAGWLDVEPNPGHKAIADMEHAGLVTGVVTQNVDGLHHEAGSMVVAEIHGNMFTSSCLLCGTRYEQHDVMDWIRRMNPQLEGKRVYAKKFIDPMCDQCGGFLKPDVVFFGDLLPETEWDVAEEIAKNSDAVVIAGTSLNVGTPHFFIEEVRRKKGPIVIVNKGVTLMDDIADIKISKGLSEVLPEIARGLALGNAESCYSLSTV